MADVAKESKKRWKDMSDEEKAPYQDRNTTETAEADAEAEEGEKVTDE